jgi:hypothetical protein
VASVNLDGSNATMIVPAGSEPIYEAEILNSNLYYVTAPDSSQANVYQIFKANLDGTGSAAISNGTTASILGICGFCGE